MGRATLYHPVSLTVIRAAAIRCGWRFGKIIQEYASEETFTAHYNAEIDLQRKGFVLFEKQVLIHQINECFAGDVEIVDVWTNRSGRVFCSFNTSIRPDPLPSMDDADPLRAVREDEADEPAVEGLSDLPF
jgi:hypothetical protein